MVVTILVHNYILPFNLTWHLMPLSLILLLLHSDLDLGTRNVGNSCLFSEEFCFRVPLLWWSSVPSCAMVPFRHVSGRLLFPRKQEGILLSEKGGNEDRDKGSEGGWGRGAVAW